MNKPLLAAFLLLLQAASAGATGSTTPAGEPSAAPQEHAQIKAVAAEFLQQQTATLPGRVSLQIGEIDRRIVLSKCARLEAFLPAGSQLVGKIQVGVRCLPPASGEETGSRPPSKGWSIFIPAQIRIGLNLLTSARQLPPGHTLQEQDLASQATETSRAGGFSDPGQVVGKVLRYGVAAGQVLREDMLRQPYSVTQGQVVQLVVQGRGFHIRSEGTALNNASEGQAVQVRVGSGRVVSGTARNGNVVEIIP